MADNVLHIIDGTNGRPLLNQHEHPAASDVRVGMLLERTTDANGVPSVQPHADGGGGPEITFVAIPHDGVGMEPGGPWGADAYAHQSNDVGDTYEAASDTDVIYITANAGVVLNMPLSPDETVGFGDFLTSNGDGTLRALNTANTGESEADAVAQVYEESVDTTGLSDFGFVNAEVL